MRSIEIYLRLGRRVFRKSADLWSLMLYKARSEFGRHRRHRAKEQDSDEFWSWILFRTSMMRDRSRSNHPNRTIQRSVSELEKALWVYFSRLEYLPGILFSILSPLMLPTWASYQLLEAKTFTDENCLGSLFSTSQRVSPLSAKENMYFEPLLVWLISTEVHFLVAGFLVLKNLPVNTLPPSVVARYTPLVLWIHNAGVLSPTLSLLPPMDNWRIWAKLLYW